MCERIIVSLQSMFTLHVIGAVEVGLCEGIHGNHPRAVEHIGGLLPCQRGNVRLDDMAVLNARWNTGASGEACWNASAIGTASPPA